MPNLTQMMEVAEVLAAGTSEGACERHRRLGHKLGPECGGANAKNDPEKTGWARSGEAWKLKHEAHKLGRAASKTVREAAGRAYQAFTAARLAAYNKQYDKAEELFKSGMLRLKHARGLARIMAQELEKKSKALTAAGTSEGAVKGWETRRRGGKRDPVEVGTDVLSGLRRSARRFGFNRILQVKPGFVSVENERGDRLVLRKNGRWQLRRAGSKTYTKPQRGAQKLIDFLKPPEPGEWRPTGASFAFHRIGTRTFGHDPGA